MKILRNILIVFVPVYYLVTWLRNVLYDLKILSSKSYDIPIICIGNLSVGGTGKTPMIELLIRLLQENYSVATLSRGYKRQTKGFIVADQNATVRSIGDEPMQLHEKFQDVIVSVDENRQRGISNLMALNKHPDIILLDDAFQHRKVTAGLNILLTSFNDLYIDDTLLPTGNLRESKVGAKRAQIVVVSKCPAELTDTAKETIRKKLRLLSHQRIFFSTVHYSDYISNFEHKKSIEYLKNERFTLVTGIANEQPLLRYLKANRFDFEHLKFRDHHNYSIKEIELIQSKPMVLTTEKDFMRLKSHSNKGNIWYLSIESHIWDETEFKQVLMEFVKS